VVIDTSNNWIDDVKKKLFVNEKSIGETKINRQF